jgi:hypothetical protein
MNTKSNKYNRFLNLLWLIPVITLGYIGWANFMPLGGTLSYSIDVGGDDTAGIARITGPFDRISAQMQADGETFRELEQSLVYFELDEPQLSKVEKITVRVRFRDNFNNDEKFVLGARNAPEWSYYWKNLYVPLYSELPELSLVAMNNDTYIYSTDPANTTGFASVEDFLQNPPTGAVIATDDKNLPINQLADVPHDETHQSDPSIINSSLRGPHTLWTYVSGGTLTLKVAKRDLNWYEEPDELAIEVYSLDGEFIGETNIPDDGDAEESKNLGPLQEIAFSTDIPSPGAYRIDLKGNSDLLITLLEINQPWLVAEKSIYLSGRNPAYYPDEKNITPVTLYGHNQATRQIRFYTWHNSGLQSIAISGDDYGKVVNIDQVKTDFFVDTPPGSYQITFPQQDILIDSAGFLAFSPESYFLPKRCEVIDLKYDLSWLVNNVDYIVINAAGYAMPEEDGGWLIAQTEWQREDLYFIDNKLSFCFNVPHLTEEPDRTIPIDRIEISLEILPFWKR